jgi:hypothetical protein
MKIGRGNRVPPVPLCPPQIPHDLTRARTRAAVVGSPYTNSHYRYNNYKKQDETAVFHNSEGLVYGFQTRDCISAQKPIPHSSAEISSERI